MSTSVPAVQRTVGRKRLALRGSVGHEKEITLHMGSLEEGRGSKLFGIRTKAKRFDAELKGHYLLLKNSDGQTHKAVDVNQIKLVEVVSRKMTIVCQNGDRIKPLHAPTDAEADGWKAQIEALHAQLQRQRQPRSAAAAAAKETPAVDEYDALIAVAAANAAAVPAEEAAAPAAAPSSSATSSNGPLPPFATAQLTRRDGSGATASAFAPASAGSAAAAASATASTTRAEAAAAADSPFEALLRAESEPRANVAVQTALEAAQRRIVDLEAELERTRAQLHAARAAATPERARSAAASPVGDADAMSADERAEEVLTLLRGLVIDPPQRTDRGLHGLISCLIEALEKVADEPGTFWEGDADDVEGDVDAANALRDERVARATAQLHMPKAKYTELLELMKTPPPHAAHVVDHLSEVQLTMNFNGWGVHLSHLQRLLDDAMLAIKESPNPHASLDAKAFVQNFLVTPLRKCAELFGSDSPDERRQARRDQHQILQNAREALMQHLRDAREATDAEHKKASIVVARERELLPADQLLLATVVQWLTDVETSLEAVESRRAEQDATFDNAQAWLTTKSESTAADLNRCAADARILQNERDRLIERRRESVGESAGAEELRTMEIKSCEARRRTNMRDLRRIMEDEFSRVTEGMRQQRAYRGRKRELRREWSAVEGARLEIDSILMTVDKLMECYGEGGVAYLRGLKLALEHNQAKVSDTLGSSIARAQGELFDLREWHYVAARGSFEALHSVIERMKRRKEMLLIKLRMLEEEEATFCDWCGHEDEDESVDEDYANRDARWKEQRASMERECAKIDRVITMFTKKMDAIDTAQLATTCASLQRENPRDAVVRAGESSTRRFKAETANVLFGSTRAAIVTGGEKENAAP